METRKLETYIDLGVVKLEVEYTYYPEYKSNDRDVPNEEERMVIDRVLWNGVNVKQALTHRQLRDIWINILEGVNDLKEASKDE
jgi:hypothetical protein